MQELQQNVFFKSQMLVEDLAYPAVPAHYPLMFRGYKFKFTNQSGPVTLLREINRDVLSIG